MIPVIEILIVGEEILSGKTIDTNSALMRSSLNMAGYDVRFISVAGDDVGALSDAFRFAAGRADAVLVTGGLGPTSDDVTVEAVAKAFGRALLLDESVLKTIRDRFRRMGRFMSDSNRKQALVPEGSEVLGNPLGTAPSLALAVDGAGPSGTGSTLYLMPGVPRECEAIFDTVVLPRIQASFTPRSIETAAVSLAGMSESQVYDTVRHLPGAEKALAYYPHYSGIEIRIRSDASSPMPAGELRDAICDLIGQNVFSIAGETMEESVARLLIDTETTVAVAESCTGGLISDRLTNVPGSSGYFLMGVVSYSNDSKTRILGVDPDVIAAHGAVSAEVAASMAEGVRRISGADIGVSTTGIAGPGGATPSKPVGLMFFGLSSDAGTVTKKLQFADDRRINKSRMSQSVLDGIRRHILNR